MGVRWECGGGAVGVQWGCVGSVVGVRWGCGLGGGGANPADFYPHPTHRTPVTPPTPLHFKKLCIILGGTVSSRAQQTF